MKKSVKTENAPAAIGPYSQGVRAGRFLYVSGQLPLDVKTKQFSGEDIKSQTEKSLINVKAILEEAGYSMQDVIKTTVFLQDMREFSLMNEVYASFFNEPYPARAAVEVAKLPKGAKVEIEAIAYKE